MNHPNRHDDVALTDREAVIERARGIVAEHGTGYPDQRDLPTVLGKLQWAAVELLAVIDEDQR